MTDYELYHQMRNMGFTEEGATQTIEVRNEFSSLYLFYDEHMGNFGFSNIEVAHFMPLILKWIKSHNDYVLLYDDGNYDNNAVWWLTTEY